MKNTLTLLTALLLAPLVALHAAEPSASRPNIVLITADDLGLQLSCYGEKNIVTPQLDRFAAEGVRFTHGYVAQSSCSPSRAALLTGKWPHQNGQIGLSHLGFAMHAGQKTLPVLLKNAGYHTGIIGKRHVEPVADVPFDWENVTEVGYGRTQNVQWVAEQSRAFLAEAKKAGRPFFYYVNYFDPHGPLNAKTDQINGLPEKPLAASDIRDPIPFGDADTREPKAATARLLNTVLRLDTGFGLLMDELKAAGVAENTLVIFVGDNGVVTPRGKTTSYELGLRVPFLVRWPGTTKPAVRAELVSLLDIVPTVLEAAGVPAPEGLAGRSLQPLLRGENVPWREFIFSEMNFHTPDFLRLQRSVRDARHKLLVTLNPRGGEPALGLYDLREDPWEKRNLADDPALVPVRRKLEAALLEWRKETADPMLDDARTQRWIAAAKKWGNAPREKVGAKMVVKVPPGELRLLE